MSYESTPEKIIAGIQNKLSVLTDLFNFYRTIEDRGFDAVFRGKTFDGIVGIIDGCIDSLDSLSQK